MNDREDPPRSRDEWRVEIHLDRDEHADTLSGALHDLQLDDEARKLLGGSVIVTRDGSFVFLYAWHEESAKEAEHVVKNIMNDEGLIGEMRLTRWHPIAEEWKDAEEPLPDDEAARAEEVREAEAEGWRETGYGAYPWEVVIDLPHPRDGHKLADQLRLEGLPVKRHFRYLLVGALAPVPLADPGGAGLVLRQVLAQAVQHLLGVLEVRTGQGQGELLASVAREDVARAEVLAPGTADLLEEAVPRLVAVGVVVLLEAVQVEYRDAERGAASVRAGELASELLVPGPAVEQAGEVVGARGDLEPAEQL